MKIAIISDIHDNMEKLNLFLLDYFLAFTAKILAKSKISVFAIFGNNNWDIGSLEIF